MQHISQILDSIKSKYMLNNRTFFSMDEFPLPNPEAPDMSIQVLLYDKDDLNNVYVGFYNFDLKKWLAFGNEENVSEFACWCFVPKPDRYRQMIGRVPRNTQIEDIVVIDEAEIKPKVYNNLNLEPKESFNNRHVKPLPKEKCIIEIFITESRNIRVDLCEWTPFNIAKYIGCELPAEGYVGTARIITGKYKGIGYHAWMQNNYEFIYWRHIQGNATYSSELNPNPNHSLP